MDPGQPPAEIGVLIDRYLLSLDLGELDDEWARSLFTADAVVEFPMSTHTGVDGLAGYHTDALAMFAGTQHLNSPAVVEFTGPGRATLRANLISTHVHHPGSAPEPIFVTGSLVTARARATARGWRLALLSVRPVWMTGSPPRPAGSGESGGREPEGRA
jgi:hypothetical protein